MDDDKLGELLEGYMRDVAAGITRAQVNIDSFIQSQAVRFSAEGLDTLIISETTAVRAEIQAMIGSIRQALYNVQTQAAQLGHEDFLRDNAGEKKLRWQVESGNPCPDCSDRASYAPRTLDEWDEMGLPGYATTVCQKSCKCALVGE